MNRRVVPWLGLAVWLGAAAVLIPLAGKTSEVQSSDPALVLPRDAEWDSLHERFPRFTGERQIVVLSVDSLQTSCGFGVPQATEMQRRTRIHEWCESKGDEALVDYRQRNNARSIDGLVNDTVPVGSG